MKALDSRRLTRKFYLSHAKGLPLVKAFSIGLPLVKALDIRRLADTDVLFKHVFRTFASHLSHV